MKCPNCGLGHLMTKQTMQAENATYRYKKCPECEWRFTSVEEIPDSPPRIPDSIRRGKVK
jgi:transcriptional regulator NrdR family protein